MTDEKLDRYMTRMVALLMAIFLVFAVGLMGIAVRATYLELTHTTCTIQEK